MNHRTAIEQAAIDEFVAAPYHGFGICQNPGCPDKKTQLCCGRTPRARICIDCFEHGFNGRHPSQRAIEGRRA